MIVIKSARELAAMELACRISANVLKLAGTDAEGIVSLAFRLLAPESELYRSMKNPSAVYGDGRASVRIANLLERL